jgi:heme/copper-type cytochrome/quinol oxidase subunit 4
MSKMAALSAMAGRAGGGMAAKMGAAGGAMGARMGAAGTALQTSQVGVAVSNTAAKEVGITINYGQIGLIAMFGFLYLVIAALGIDMFNKCPEQEGKSTQENLKNFLSYTLTIALTVPCTLLMAKTAGSKLSGIIVLLFGIIGVVGSSASLNWARTCESAKKDDSKMAFSAVSLVIFLLAFLGGLFMLRPGKVKIA